MRLRRAAAPGLPGIEAEEGPSGKGPLDAVYAKKRYLVSDG